MFNKSTLYAMAQISMNKDGELYLTWYGTHPDQGGLTERTGQVCFQTMDDLLMFAHSKLTRDSTEVWPRRINEAEQAKEAQDASPVLEGDGSAPTEGSADGDSEHEGSAGQDEVPPKA